MKINRRQFLSGVAAASAVALVGAGSAKGPVLHQDFRNKIVLSSGIENWGNGWYRCWVKRGKKIISTYVKQVSEGYFKLGIEGYDVFFDLEKGCIVLGGSDEELGWFEYYGMRVEHG